MRRELIQRLRQHADDVRRLTAGLADETLHRRIAADQWSLGELVCHLLRVQHLFEERIGLMIDRDSPAFESYAPENDAGFGDFVAAHQGRRGVDAFVAQRDAFSGRIDAFTPTQWRRTGHHPTFGIFDVEFLVEYMVHHEAHHIYQMFMRRVRL